MQSYTYKGGKKLYPRPLTVQNNNYLFKNIGFILSASQPMLNTKMYGNKILYKYKDSEVLEYNLDLIYSICEHPEVIVISGFDNKSLLKHPRKNEFTIVENQLHEISNSSEDLRLGLQALKSPHCVFIDSVLIPTVSTMKYLLASRDMSSKIYTKKIPDDYIGVLTEEKYISKFTFSSPNKLLGMYFINTHDIDRIRKKSLGKHFTKNKYAFELFKEVHTVMIDDESDSILVAR